MRQTYFSNRPFNLYFRTLEAEGYSSYTIFVLVDWCLYSAHQTETEHAIVSHGTVVAADQTFCDVELNKLS